MPTCDSCMFYREYSELGGHCMRYPPVVIATFYYAGEQKMPTTDQYFPSVQNSDVCGEYKPKELV